MHSKLASKTDLGSDFVGKYDVCVIVVQTGGGGAGQVREIRLAAGGGPGQV